ncbi:hypothetical protein NECAME_15398 [Necator americanus]|uniref:Uncharacterized protein n=1 Tax=Necator americanus TaxID=51031 RepID=W2SI31_NECAM|nr:hypothetical protein NECAME_15398 [Necator americanus]ETN69289.1 hypothetical protein NECAME_15398 [Necator americanus]
MCARGVFEKIHKLRNTMRGRARSYCYLSNDREAFMRSPLPMRNLNPFYLSQFSFGRETACITQPKQAGDR